MKLRGFGRAVLPAVVVIGSSGWAAGVASAASLHHGGTTPLDARERYLADEFGLSASRARAQADFLDSVERVVGGLVDRYPAQWAGAWVDNAKDRVLNVGITTVAAKAAIERELTRSLGAGRFQVVLRRHTVAELSAQSEITAASLPVGAAASPGSRRNTYEIEVDVTTNKVKAVVDPSVVGSAAHRSSTAKSAAALAPCTAPLVAAVPTFGPAADAVEITVGAVAQPTEVACAGRSHCDPPLRAGIRLDGPFACTSGFVMRRLGDSAPLLLTAGHCGDGSWSHNGHVVGRTVLTQTSGSVDAALVSIDDSKFWGPTNLVYRDANQETRVTAKITTPSKATIGVVVCSEGASGGERCGAITSLDHSIKGLSHMGRTAGSACPGDSGAPVLNKTTNTAYGIVDLSGKNCSSPMYFSWTSNIEAALGARLHLG